MSHVAIAHLEKTFPGGVQALRDVNLEIAGGEYFVVVGPSGSGKTTLLRIIAGLDAPTAGEILIGGRRVNDEPPHERGVAMVFQSPALYPHLSVRRNLAFGLRQMSLSTGEIEAQIADVAERLSISSLFDRMPAELSGGEGKRVAIGRALARRPRVLLLDEPLADLDAPLRAQLRFDLAQLGRETDVAVIHVTHDQAEAMALGDRLCVLNAGEVQQVAQPTEVYNRPANALVASFIGAPGMNLIRGELRDSRFVLRHAGAPIALDLSAQAMEQSSNIPREPVLLGVRPEDLTEAGDGVHFPPVIVERVELMGNESVAYFPLAGERLAVRRSKCDAVRPGETALLAAAVNALHWFSASNGRRLT